MAWGEPPAAPPAATQRRRTTCTGCRYFFITHDSQRPYGCQLLGFKSRRAPALEVLSASGEDCRGYEPRL